MASSAGAATGGRIATAAIDFGTSGTSAVVALSASRNDGVPARVSLDGRGGDGTSGKSPTAVLLLAEAPHKFVAFGLDAFARYKDAKVNPVATSRRNLHINPSFPARSRESLQNSCYFPNSRWNFAQAQRVLIGGTQIRSRSGRRIAGIGTSWSFQS